MTESTRHKIGAVQLWRDLESKTASGQLGKILEHAIEKLPENHRTVVMMRDVEEMSTSETAEYLSLTEENVKIRLHCRHGCCEKGSTREPESRRHKPFLFRLPDAIVPY
jgi:DNA-directed RNA polymerase specialized sigma24 family protein